MAGSQVEVAINQIEKQRLGYQAISLTNFDNDSEPQIASGSKVEIGGALFEFTSNESITGWGSIGNNNDVYIKLVVSGTSVTAEFTTTAPSWSTSKQGWYDSLDRYIGGLYKDGSGNYTEKFLYDPTGRPIRKENFEDDAVVTSKIKDSNVTTAKIADYNATIKKITKSFSNGTQDIAGYATWQIPEGLVQIIKTSSLGEPRLELYINGAWRQQADNQNNGAWLVRSDGSNMRLYNNVSSTTTIFYQRFQ